MRKLLNTLYVTTPGAYLSLDGNNVVILKDGNVLFRIPVCNTEGIVCFNYLGASPKLMKYCTDNNIFISFLTPSGEFLASVYGKIRGNVLLRKKQYLMSEDPEFCLGIAKNIIKAKIFNSRVEINRSIRDNQTKIDVARLKYASDRLKELVFDVDKCKDFSELRGVEGDSARMYFSAFNDMIIQHKNDFVFHGRSRRPPLDNVNALLSFGYSLLAREIEAALISVGLDPYVGFLHTDRPGRISLALDIIEEFRAAFVDRFVLTLINLRQITKKDFIKKESGAIVLTDNGRKVFLGEWQKRKFENVMHPFLGERVRLGLFPYVQAMILSRYLRNEIDTYIPYFKRN
jgi:CRISPR-associated protein Cas1